MHTATRRYRPPTWLFWLMALVVASVLPTGYFAVRYADQGAALETKALVKADQIAALVGEMPHIWRFQVLRLEEVLRRSPALAAEERLAVFDERGVEVVTVGAEVVPLAMVRSTPIYDAGLVVGRLELRHSLRDLALGAAMLALVGALLGAVLAYAAYLLVERRATSYAQNEQRSVRQRAQLTLEAIGDAIISLDAARSLRYLNPAAAALLALPPGERHGPEIGRVLRLFDGAGQDLLTPLLESALSHPGEQRFTGMQLRRVDGSVIEVDGGVTAYHPEAHGEAGMVMCLRDVSEARRMAEQISFQANFDALTGLHNRASLERRLAALLAQAGGQPHALLYLDIDHFKLVNDTCGHLAGDQLVRQIGLLIKGGRQREADLVARVGGDQFAVLLTNCPGETAMEIAEALLAEVRVFAFRWLDRDLPISASIGLARFGGEHQTDLSGLLITADSACHIAKQAGGNRIHGAHPGETQVADLRREMDWVARLNRAMSEDRLRLYAQRIVAVDAMPHPPHYEILLRVLDEAGAVHPPAELIQAAERYHVMERVDRWVLMTTLTHCAALMERHPEAVDSVWNVNLSGQSLGAQGFLEFARLALTRANIPPGMLCFEVTETAAIAHLEAATHFMVEMRALGCRFALDDFGSGLSSFAYLKTLPVDYLKIDGGFVREMTRDARDRAIVAAIHSAGHSLGLKTVAEFVAEAEILPLLAEIGVDLAQGYAIALPVPLESGHLPS